MPRKENPEREPESTKKTLPVELSEIIPKSEGIMCDSCGKFVGAYERCPHCQAHVNKRMPIIWVRRFAVIGSILGLIMMWFASVNKDIPRMMIGTLVPENNMALVRIIGTVTKINIRDGNTFSYKVEDETGYMSMMGFDKLSRFQKHFGTDGMPGEGDKIEVVGNLSISDKFGASLFLGDPRRVKILERFQPRSTTIEDIDVDSRGEVLNIRAKIAGVRELRKKENDELFAYVITLKDATGSMDMTLFEGDRLKITNPDLQERLLNYGNEFDMQVMVSEYKGRIQLVLRSPEKEESLKLVSGPSQSDVRLAIKDVTEELVDEMVEVEGVVTRAKSFQFGTSIDIKDDTGQINVWLREKVAARVARLEDLTAPGARLKVRGIIKVRKGNLQVTLERGNDIVVLAPGGAAAAPQAEELPLPVTAGTLTDEFYAKRVLFSGRVDSAKEFDFGLISLNLMDESGIANVVIQKKDAEKFTDKSFLTQGKILTVTGRVDRYKDKLQIILSDPKDLKVE